MQLGFDLMRLLAVPAVFAVFACSAASGSNPSNDDGATVTTTTAGGAGGAGGAVTTTSAMGGTVTVATATSTGSGGNFVAEVYGNSPDVLYKLDPLTNVVTEVGKFSGCSSVIDIAINKDFELFGTAFSGLYRIDKRTAVCTLIKSGSYPNSLGFVPEGTVFPDKEALVGYFGADYVRIDPVTGATTTIGALTGGYQSSGDIVSVKDGGTYLTVRGTACTHDCLAEIDPKTGKLIKNWGDLGHDSLYGLAYWGGRAYGFSDAGELLEIKFDSQGVAAVPIPFPSKPPNLQFNGAGSSTVAPVMRPN